MITKMKPTVNSDGEIDGVEMELIFNGITFIVEFYEGVNSCERLPDFPKLAYVGAYTHAVCDDIRLAQTRDFGYLFPNVELNNQRVQNAI